MCAKARVRVKPKRYFVDPSLAVALLNAIPERLSRDIQTLGMLFENLVLRDLRVFLSSYPGMGNTLSYYRDDTGLEVDVIVEHASRWAGIEIKLSDTKVGEGAESLVRLRDKVLKNRSLALRSRRFLPSSWGRAALRTGARMACT